MAQWTGSGSNQSSYKLQLNVNEGSYDIATNTSPVTITLYFITGSAYYEGWSTSWSCSVNGTGYNGSFSDCSPNSTKTLLSTTLTVTHEDNGSKTISCAAYLSRSGASYLPGTISCGGDLVLATIPRASVPTLSPTTIEVNGTNNIIISTNKKASFYHKIKYTFGTTTAQIGTGVVDSITWTPAKTLLNQMTTAQRGTGTITCTTYSESACTTQIGSAQTVDFTLTTTNTTAPPTITGLSQTDGNSKSIALENTGTFIKYVSDVTTTGTAAGQYGATITSVVVSNGTKSVTSSSGTINATISGIETGTTKVVATDSRGYQTTVNLTPTTIDYVPITITNGSIRNQPTDGIIKVLVNGSYFNGSFGKSSNTLAFTYTYQMQNSDGTWATAVTGTETLTPTINTADKIYSIGQNLTTIFSYTSAVKLTINATDAIKTVSSTKVVLQGIPIVSIGAQPAPHFDVFGDLEVRNRDDTTKSSTISTNSYGSLNVTASNNVNVSTGYGVNVIGTVTIKNHTDVTKSSTIETTASGKLQVTTNGISYIYHPEAFAVGAVYITVDSTNPATTLGYGTWVPFAKGRTLVGVDTGQTEFYNVEKTGGSKEKQLSLENYQQNTYHTGGSSISDSISFYVSSGTTYGIANRYELPNKNVPISLLQPYITVYFWKRTA